MHPGGWISIVNACAASGLVVATIMLYRSAKRSANSTQMIADATRDTTAAIQQLARETRSVLEEEWRPRVVVYFEVPARGCDYAYICVTNLGRLPAENVTLSFDPKLEGIVYSTNRTQISDMVPMLKDGIRILPPGLVMRSEIAPLDMYFRQYKDEDQGDSNNRISYEVTIQYSGGLAEDPTSNEHEEVYRIGLFDWMMIESARPRTFDDLISVLEEIKWQVERSRHEVQLDDSSDRRSSRLISRCRICKKKL